MKYTYPTKDWLEIEWILTTKPLTQIAKEINIPYKNLEYCARVKYGLSKKYNYTIDDAFFDITNPDFQYFLGLLYADGNTYKKTGVVIEQKDKQIIVDLKKAMCYSGKLYTYTTKTSERHRLHITNVKLRDLVELYGITPAKTDSIRLPKLESYSHFMRGFFDGDGNIKKDKLVARWYCHSRAFNLDVVNLLSQLGINTTPKVYKGRSGTHVELTQAQSAIFLDWIYKDRNLFMKRKYDIYLKHIS